MRYVVNDLLKERDDLREKLAAMETELAELRAYKEAAEGQKHSHVIDWEYDDDPDDADARGDLVIHQLNGMEYQRGTKLYAHPIPSQQADKQAVAVPTSIISDIEFALDAIYNETVMIVCCGRPGQECCGSPDVDWPSWATEAMTKLSSVRDSLIEAAPSPSQQSAATDAERFCDAHCTWRDHRPDCHSHESEQSALTAPDDIDRLVEHAAVLGIGLRDDDQDLPTESWRSLPDHLQKAINEKTELLDFANSEFDVGN